MRVCSEIQPIYTALGLPTAGHDDAGGLAGWYAFGVGQRLGYRREAQDRCGGAA